MTTHRQFREVWIAETGMGLSTTDHTFGGLIDEGLIRRNKQRGKNSLHVNETEAAYFGCAAAAVVGGFPVIHAARVARLLYGAASDDLSILAANPLGGGVLFPEILPSESLGETISNAIVRSAHASQGIQPTDKLLPKLEITFCFRPKSDPSIDVTHFGLDRRGRETSYPKSYHMRPEVSERDYLDFFVRRDFRCAIQCAVTLTSAHFDLFGLMLADSWRRHDDQTVSAATDTKSVATKNAASPGREAAHSVDPENLANQNPRAQDHDLDNYGHYARALSCARDDSGFGGGFFPSSRSQPYVQHYPVGD